MSQETTKIPSAVSCRLGKKFYGGQRGSLSTQEVKKGVYEAELPYQYSPTFFSMIYVYSPGKPLKVELLANEDVLGLCEETNIREVPLGTNFEDFDWVESRDEGSEIPDPNFRSYKAVMFGKKRYLNWRNGFDTESYFLPIHDLKYTIIKIRVSFEDTVEDFSLSVELIARDKTAYGFLGRRGDELVTVHYLGGVVGVLSNPELTQNYLRFIKSAPRYKKIKTERNLNKCK